MGADIVQLLAGKVCGMCEGTGKMPTYRGPRQFVRCIFCDGTGRRAASK